MTDSKPAEHAQIRGIVLDVADPAGPQSVADTIRATHDGLDVVVNNAVMRVGPDDDPRDIVTDYAEVNNLGTTRTMRAFAWPAFVNISSKIGQVAAVRTLAGHRRVDDLARDVMVYAVCPGMINTPTFGVWWDVSDAPTPDQAAAPLVDLITGPSRRDHYGQLVRDGHVLPWKPWATTSDGAG